MAIGDFTEREASTIGSRGSRKYLTATGATLINPGEPVTRGVTGIYVTRMYGSATGTIAPVVATDYVVGVAQTTSTNTTSATGYVEVLPTDSSTTWLATPTTPANFTPQATYDALVGSRVLISSDGTTYTVENTSGTTNGLVIMPLDIAKYPGKVAIAFRQALSDVN